MNDLGVIHLTNGGFTVVDADLFEELNQYNWQRCTRLYHTDHAYRGLSVNGKRKTLMLHQAILPLPKGVPIDHKNGFGLDNTRRNLRPASKSKNAANSTPRKRKPNSKFGSKFKGVWFRSDCRKKPWQARIGCRDTLKFLGTFQSEVEAAKAYNSAAIERFGEFAKLNEF